MNRLLATVLILGFCGALALGTHWALAAPFKEPQNPAVKCTLPTLTALKAWKEFYPESLFVDQFDGEIVKRILNRYNQLPPKSKADATTIYVYSHPKVKEILAFLDINGCLSGMVPVPRSMYDMLIKSVQ
jgi:hypothetical protein